MKVFVGPSSDFAAALDDRMDALKLNPTDLHRRLGDVVGYEHVRRVMRGEAFPSDKALRAICSALEMDFDDMKRLVDEARVKARYGDVVAEMTGRSPELDRLERVWKQLNREQKETLLDVVGVIARRNKNSPKKRIERQRQLHLDVS